jgi:uncharacterized membrane protein
MTTQLRPLALGEILDRTAELYRNNFLLFAGIAAIFSAAMLLVELISLGVLNLLGYPNVQGARLWAVGGVVVAEALAIMLMAGLAVAANNRAVAWVHLGETATIRAASQSIVPRLGRYLWVMTLTFLRAWSPLAVFYIVFYAIVFSLLPAGFFAHPGVVPNTPPPDPSKAIHAAIAMLILAPLMLGSAVYGTWMFLRYSLAMPASVVENLPAAQALKRSVHLSKGSRGRILVLGLLVYAVRMLLGVILGMPYMIVVFKHAGQLPSLLWMAEAQFAGFVTNTLIGPIYATGLTLFYYDQRVRKEGFDIEWMMHQAGLNPDAEAGILGAAEAVLPAVVVPTVYAVAPDSVGER